MNQTSSTDSPISSPPNADAISRRAYELWEKEGRPEGCDLRHWLQAEGELGSSRTDNEPRPADAAPMNTGSDVNPLQGTRAAAAANRENRRGSATPFNPAKNAPGNGNAQSATRRKPTNAPAL